MKHSTQKTPGRSAWFADAANWTRCERVGETESPFESSTMKLKLVPLFVVLAADWSAYGNPGDVRWSFATGAGILSSPALGRDGTIYCGADDGNLYAISATGSNLWVFGGGIIINSSPAIGSGGDIYFGSVSSNIFALRPDGTLKWSFATSDGVGGSPAIAADATIYCGSFDGKLYAMAS